MRIFLSFNSKDAVLAEALRAGIARLEPAAEVFFSRYRWGRGSGCPGWPRKSPPRMRS